LRPAAPPLNFIKCPVLHTDWLAGRQVCRIHPAVTGISTYSTESYSQHRVAAGPPPGLPDVPPQWSKLAPVLHDRVEEAHAIQEAPPGQRLAAGGQVRLREPGSTAAGGAHLGRHAMSRQCRTGALLVTMQRTPTASAKRASTLMVPWQPWPCSC
jgi:hypothetical protein